MARAEGGLVPSGVGYAQGCPLFSQLEGLGERRMLPQRGPGLPGQKRILAFSEGHRTLILYLYDKICGEQFALSSPTPNSGGHVSPVPP